MPHAYLIRTPTDFRQTVGGSDYIQCPLLNPPSAIEPDFRRALDAIFTDLQYVGGDPDLLAPYLEAITEPLEQLWALGFAIFAVVTKGTLTLPDFENPSARKEIKEWQRVYYLIVPHDGFFRVGEDLSTTVHKFDPTCQAAVKALASACGTEERVAVWGGAEGVKAGYEGNVPWCSACCLEESVIG